MTLARDILNFYENLELPDLKDTDIELLLPFSEPEVKEAMAYFFNKYFADQNPRTMLVGINPGRFGGGTTGIPFTDPINLEKYCGIPNKFEKRHELSSKFIYDMISGFGGPDEFYSRYYFYSVSPVGFTKGGKNFNYYDDPKLKEALEEFIVRSFEEHFRMGMSREVAYSLGQGRNITELQGLNKKYGFFKDIKPLPHPRWVMQYRLKRKEEFIDMYLRELQK